MTKASASTSNTSLAQPPAEPAPPRASGEDVGEGQGSGPRKDTGTYDSRQWADKTTQPSRTQSDT